MHLAEPPPASDHARLAEREGDEDADRVERNQIGHAALEDQDQRGGHHRQDDDAHAESQPVAPEGELVRQEAVAGQEEREAREIGEGGVGRQHQ